MTLRQNFASARLWFKRGAHFVGVGAVDIPVVLVVLSLFPASSLLAQQSGFDTGEQPNQDLNSSRWSIQGTWVTNGSFYGDTLADGEARPEGVMSDLQTRIAYRVTPKRFIKVPILSRLKLQKIKSKYGNWGTAPTELFSLAVPKDWGSGQFAIGPLVRFPVSNSEFGNPEYTFGFSTGIIQRFDKHKLLVGLLIRQTWGKTDPLNPGALVAQAMALNPVINLRLGGGYYIQNGGMVGLLNWKEDGGFYLPIAVRIGKVFITKNGSWNISAEYRTSAIYKNWSGPAVKNAFRLNIGFSLKGSPDLLAIFD